MTINTVDDKPGFPKIRSIRNSSGWIKCKNIRYCASAKFKKYRQHEEQKFNKIITEISFDVY